MSQLKTKYNPSEIESSIYDFWIENDLFKAKGQEKKPYCLVIPPPNVTGKLHLGHAWDNTLQDIIIRRKRMQGYDALFLPGMDHAGIATQAKIEERLKTEGTDRFSLGREGFLERAFKWKEEYEKLIHEQWRVEGISVDYSKERFTLDQGLNKAVNHVFITLYNKGLIYRGNRIINWDPQAKTALSNIEVEHKETEGFLYYLRYPFVDGSSYLVVATTRPETCFADQAVMVHPEDERYQHLVGKSVYIPGTNVMIPIIFDDYVDKEFGTGVVKVTPAHDPNDFEVGVRHNLNMPLCMNEDGTMNEMAFQYMNLDRFEARKKLIADLEKKSLVDKIEPYTNSVGYSERTGVVVEPRLSLQWFLKMEPLSKEALKTKVNFYPERFKKIFFNWMTDTQDWCISRQLWWGHRIPAWYKGNEVSVQTECPGEGWKQDEDVLDTWFSSALWPFSTLGWPEETSDFKRYYPTDCLVTGYDIIFFWVARMIFQGLEFTGKDPFKDVLIHGLIRAADGRKMSKSYGNGVDPIDIANKYGMDSLRYFLTTNSAPGADLRFDESKVESSWNFINKLWNITRFISLNITDKKISFDESSLELKDRYILSRLSLVISSVDELYEKYEFAEVASILYNFIWDEFASYYVEFSKLSLQETATANNTKGVLLYLITAILKMLHPFIPFVTEKLYHEVSDDLSIMTSSWPKAGFFDQESIADFECIKDIIQKVRNVRSENNIAPSKNLSIILVTENKDMLEKEIKYLKKFLNSSDLVIQLENPKGDYLTLVSNSVVIHILKSELIDKKALKELLEKQKLQLEQEIERSNKMLNNEAFLSKAKEEKVNAEKEKHASYLRQYEVIKKKIDETI
ncbi:valine--tRNA ligase [Acholeplasma sp. OttesenSCG-928-E16]|nr:valine--tRNA ligase [Acholeplasma sp. OttesenSCG-928-E16]